MKRQPCVAGLGLLIAAMLCIAPPLDAQGKKDDKQVQRLQQLLKEKEQQINKLEAQLKKLKISDNKDDAKLAQLNQRIKQLEAELKKKPGGADKLKKDLDAANLALKEKDQLIATLRQKAPKANAELAKEVEKLRANVRTLDALKNAPVVHAMMLKLKKTDDAQVKLIHDEALATLGKFDGVRGLWVGKPVEPDLTAKGYHLGVIALFDDSAMLRKFLDDPLHKRFNDKLADYWEPPVVVDIQRDPDAKK